MKKNLFDYFVWLMTIVFVITIFFLPDTVPMHWNIEGEVDRIGSRYEMIIVAILPLLTYYGMLFTKKIDPKYEMIVKKDDIYELFRRGLTIYFICIAAYVYMMSLKMIKSDSSFFIYLMISCMFIWLGNYMPKIPQNHFLGIKTPWTISSETVWRKTHRMGGHLIVIAGICMTICSFIDGSFAMMIIIAFALGISVWSYIYSYMLYKNIEREE